MGDVSFAILCLWFGLWFVWALPASTCPFCVAKNDFWCLSRTVQESLASSYLLFCPWNKSEMINKMNLKERWVMSRRNSVLIVESGKLIIHKCMQNYTSQNCSRHLCVTKREKTAGKTAQVHFCAKSKNKQAWLKQEVLRHPTVTQLFCVKWGCRGERGKNFRGSGEVREEWGEG